MGTTQRIVPGVTGDPNWGNLSKSITSVAKTVEKESATEEEQEKDPEKLEKNYAKLISRRDKHIKAAFNNLIKTGGGAKAVSSGNSNSIGKAGSKSSGKIVSFISGVARNGLQAELDKLGFGTLEGKSVQDVINYLLIYTSDSSTGMDETAANKASCEVLNEIADQTNNNLERFEELLSQYVNNNALSDLLCRFWGLYVFEHLSQRFQEKVTQQKGEEVSKETFKIIKDDILGRIQVLNEQRPVNQIDWGGKEGTEEIKKIFESIINIICDEE